VLALMLAAGLATQPWAARSNTANAGGPPTPFAGSPIKHVVVIYQENHSFNDILGALCVQENDRCVGTTQGEISDGTKMPLTPEPDIPPEVGHKSIDQAIAINGGLMNGWDNVFGCGSVFQYRCLTQVQAGTLPNLWSMADTFAMSDMTFESGASASWGSHIQLVAATMDGFVGDQPQNGTGPGAGCDSLGDVVWFGPDGQRQVFPSCIPDKNGQGPYKPSPVPYVPTIMDSMDAAGLKWHIYAPGKRNAGYGWAICPTFYECLGSDQASKVRQPNDFARDAAKGTLANLSLVIPYYNDSQHPGFSLMRGDNWIASNVAAVMNGPDWKSTAIFITYDDCGCFYDPVAPPTGEGIREPMIIVSPYARAGFVDHTTANHASLLAFTEHLFGLAPLNAEDANAYDFADAFNFAQRPLALIRLPLHTVPRSSVLYIAKHPPNENDPT
jgi:phospholipase C